MLATTTTHCPPGGLAGVRAHLAAAAEARRRGDHAAADCHETEALQALRAALTPHQREARA